MGKACLYGVGTKKTAQEFYRVEQIINGDECELVVVTDDTSGLQSGDRYYIEQSIQQDSCILAFSQIYEAV